MPRKKKEDTGLPEAPAASTPVAAPTAGIETPPAKAKPGRPRKQPVTATPATASVADAPVAEILAAKPKATRSSKAPKAAPVEVSPVEPTPVVVETTPVVTEKPRGRGRPKRQVEPESTPAPLVVVEAAEAPVAEAKVPAKRGRKPGKAPAPAVAPANEAEAETAEPIVRPEGFDYASLELPMPAWRPRSKGPKAASQVVEAVDSESAEVAAKPEATEASDSSETGGNQRRRRRRRRRGGRDPQETSLTSSATTDEEGDDEGDEDELTADAPVEAVATPAPLVAEPAKPRPLFDKGRKGKPEPKREEAKREEPKRPEAKTEEPKKVEAVKVEAPVEAVRRERPTPKPPEKAMIAIPTDAPQVIMRDGLPTLVRNGQVYPPIMFFGSPADEKRSETVFEEVRMAAEAKVHLHSFFLDFEVSVEAVDESAALAAYLLAQTVAIDPNCQVVFRLAFLAPRNWEDKYPDAKYRTVDGRTAEPSLSDDNFWNLARQCLETFCRKLRLLDLRDHILGLHLERGEWFLPDGYGYDTSKAAQRRFQAWARTRYGNDEVTLRASWFDGDVRFDNLAIPPYNPEGSDGEKFIRSSRKQRRYVDYHLFLSDVTVQRISDLAYAAKSASEGYFLLGVSYGYTFEWSHPDSGHLSLGKLLRTPEIDFIAGPPSYRTREPGGSAAFPGPIDSFALNGKLFLSEEDYKTSLSSGHEPDDFNPRLKTPQALESVHWRGAGAALAHGSGVAWMDLWGNGWLKTHSVWERAQHVRDAMIDRMTAPLGDPEVAVFIDERALAYLVDTHAFTVLVQNVRESILRAGVSVGFYLLSDLAHREKFPESKLYIFVNAWDIRPELRAAIKSRLQRNDKVLFWLYSAGLFDAGRDSLERAREVTGIAIKPQPFYSKAGTTILNRRHPLSEAFPDKNVSAGSKLEPTYFAIPEGATILGEYTQTGLPSFVVKEFREGPAETHWTSVFLGEPQVNPALIRALAQMAGAHVWNFHEDVVHVRPPFCTVHCAAAGPRTVTLPKKYSAYNLLTNEWAAIDSVNLRFTAVDGSTHCFLIGAKDELEAMLKADPADLLKVDHIPPREHNIRIDVANFDVPIMRLDEWIEGSDSDDNADEWFLRPAPAEEESLTTAETTPERVGRRRRRRKGRNGSDGESFVPESRGSSRPESFVPADPQYDDIGMNVVFRKRE